jgi:hypothetical protein
VQYDKPQQPLLLPAGPPLLALGLYVYDTRSAHRSVLVHEELDNERLISLLIHERRRMRVGDPSGWAEGDSGPAVGGATLPPVDSGHDEGIALRCREIGVDPGDHLVGCDRLEDIPDAAATTGGGPSGRDRDLPLFAPRRVVLGSERSR